MGELGQLDEVVVEGIGGQGQVDDQRRLPAPPALAGPGQAARQAEPDQLAEQLGQIQPPPGRSGAQLATQKDREAPGWAEGCGAELHRCR